MAPRIAYDATANSCAASATASACFRPSVRTASRGPCYRHRTETFQVLSFPVAYRKSPRLDTDTPKARHRLREEFDQPANRMDDDASIGREKVPESVIRQDVGRNA